MSTMYLPQIPGVPESSEHGLQATAELYEQGGLNHDMSFSLTAVAFYSMERPEVKVSPQVSLWNRPCTALTMLVRILVHEKIVWRTTTVYRARSCVQSHDAKIYHRYK